MKTNLYWVALVASAALTAQARAGGHHGGSAHFAGSGFARGSSVPSFHSMPARSFGGGRMMYSGPRFSAAGRYAPSSSAFRQRNINSSSGASFRAPQFARGNINRGDRLTRFSNGANRAIANSRREGNGAGQFRSRNNLPANWQSHVVAQRSANWHREWDRNRDHSWNGHHCRFINGSWFIFDPWFYPGAYWYPDDYYASDYYAEPYGYDSGNDDSGTTISAAQEQLARQGYYRGEIDGILGPETRRALARYQGNQGLRVTGDLSAATLQTLELRGVARY